jgi:hypothetical protein
VLPRTAVRPASVEGQGRGSPGERDLGLETRQAALAGTLSALSSPPGRDSAWARCLGPLDRRQLRAGRPTGKRPGPVRAAVSTAQRRYVRGKAQGGLVTLTGPAGGPESHGHSLSNGAPESDPESDLTAIAARHGALSRGWALAFPGFGGGELQRDAAGPLEFPRLTLRYGAVPAP